MNHKIVAAIKTPGDTVALSQSRSRSPAPRLHHSINLLQRCQNSRRHRVADRPSRRRQSQAHHCTTSSILTRHFLSLRTMSYYRRCINMPQNSLWTNKYQPEKAIEVHAHGAVSAAGAGATAGAAGGAAAGPCAADEL